MIFRPLKADEIECRIGSVGAKGFTMLLYKDARCDMNILDDTVGEHDWQRVHKEIKGTIYCGVGIRDNTYNDWVWKWDIETPCHSFSYKAISFTNSGFFFIGK